MILFGYDTNKHGMVRLRIHVNDVDRVTEVWRARGLEVSAYTEPDDPPTVDELLAGLDLTESARRSRSEKRISLTESNQDNVDAVRRSHQRAADIGWPHDPRKL